MIHRRRVIIGALGATAGLTAAGCSSPSHASGGAGATGDQVAGNWQTPSSGAPSGPAAPPVQLTVTPATGSADVSPTAPVTVAVEGGKLKSVTVTAGKKTVSGSVQADGVSWRSTGTLSYDTTYQVTASVVDAAGTEAKKTSTFSTLKPKAVAGITFQANGMGTLKTGGTYGVGQPVIVAFSKAIKDKAAAEKAIAIKTTPAVDGKFFWVNSSIVHWRPAKYWAKGTSVEVSVTSLGVDLGNGTYGAANASTHFTIGRALVAVCDNDTHRTRVYVDGKMVRDMACSTGRGGYTTISNGQQIHFWTQSGPHVVLEKTMTHSMSSASYGLTDPNDPFYYAPEDVQWCTRISYSGEFLHAAPWNHQLGRANISHGCVNLSVADAEWVYNTFIVGDVVEVNHSPKALPVTDGLGDWTVPYDRYGT
jgi:lipoprotein-anchoring transpeptidase ErfK/SrfK